MHWTQNYDPLGSPLLSTLVAALPIVFLLGLLATGRIAAPAAALAGLVTALVCAIFVFKPPEIAHADSAGLAGWAATMLAAAGPWAAVGLLPPGWVVLSAGFLFTLPLESGDSEIV